MTQQNKASLEDVKRRFESATPETKGSARFDQWRPERYDDPMQDAITRPELDAKLELIEARADARMSRFEERIDQAIGEMRRDSDRVYGAIGNLKSTTIVTGVTAVIAIVFGVAAFNATLLSNMTASFESGKSTATALTQATEQMRQTQEQLKEIQAQLSERAKIKIRQEKQIK